MKKITAIAMTLLILIGSIPAYAECDFNGYKVPAGSKAGGRTCQEDGQWE